MVKQGHEIYRFAEIKQRGTETDTSAGRAAQGNGQNGKRNRGINWSATESRKRNMDGVSAQGRSSFGSEPGWASGRNRQNSSPRGRNGDTGDDSEPATEGIRDARVSLDAEEDLHVCMENIN